MTPASAPGTAAPAAAPGKPALGTATATVRMIIAIDGPAAAGKGTLARALAQALDLPYLDTGLLYRATTARLLDRARTTPAFDPLQPETAAAEAARLTPDDLARPDLRTPEIDRLASSVASIPAVRAALLAWQRSFGQTHGAVLDGRDIGTVIFPDAHTKFFVTASVAARAHRRHQEQQARGLPTTVAPTLAQVQTDLETRDAADVAREAAPLRPAPDAVTLDTTALTPAQAFATALAVIQSRL